MKDTYNCINCKEEWTFCPEDYEHKEDYPAKCPLCSTPITQMIGDTFKEGGLLEKRFSDELYQVFEEQFLKGKSEERGAALVLYAHANLLFRKFLSEAKCPKKPRKI